MAVPSDDPDDIDIGSVHVPRPVTSVHLACWAKERALLDAIRVALGTMQKPMEAMGWFCRNDMAHNHDHVRALRAAMKVLQDAHDAALSERTRLCAMR